MFFTLAKNVMFSPLSVCLSVSRITHNSVDEFWYFFRWLGCVTSDERLECLSWSRWGCRNFYRNFCHCWRGAIIARLLPITQEVVDGFLWNFWGAGCLTGNKSFDFGDDPDPGILTEFLQLRDMDNCKNIKGPPTCLAEVCGPRVLLDTFVFK